MTRKIFSADTAFMTFVALVMAFLYLPIWVLIAYSFNNSSSLSWPPSGFTLAWYEKLAGNTGLQTAIGNSFYVAAGATALTLLIGVPASLALHRFDFPGKTLFRRLILLPITLPGIVTGISMLNTFKLAGLPLSLETVIIGHATALIGIVVTQVYARLQRLPATLQEAAFDLGAGPWRSFVDVILPNIRSAIVSAGLLSFVLSFDEIPVTYFLTGRDNTLPMYIYSTMRRGITPEINAIGSLIVLLSVVLMVVSIVISRRGQRAQGSR